MGQRANYIIKTGAEFVIHYTHWRSICVAADLYLGEKAFVSYVKDCDVSDVLLNEPWIEACVIVDLGEKKLQFWCGNLTAGESVAEYYLMQLAQKWVGWEITILENRMYEVEALLRVNYIAYQEKIHFFTATQQEITNTEYGDYNNNLVVIKHKGELFITRTSGVWSEAFVTYGEGVIDLLLAKPQVDKLPTEADEYGCVIIDTDQKQLIIDSSSLHLWQEYGEKWDGYKLDMGNRGYLEMLRLAGLDTAGLLMPEDKILEQFKELIRYDEGFDPYALAASLAEVDGVEFNEHYFDTVKPRQWPDYNPLDMALVSLRGLFLGDAFGETFFGPEEEIADRLLHRKLQDGLWQFTDDTVMGIGIYNILAQYSCIDQDALAREFAHNYQLDDKRGYGGTAHLILRSISDGKNWKEVSEGVFDGMGSMGNGAAMRSGPIGAYFFNDVDAVILQATLAAEVTHAHPEAIAGAVAVALAACYCFRSRHDEGIDTPAQFFDFILLHTPESHVKSKIKKASTLPADYDVRTIVSILGNGTQLTAQDTVPFALWCAAHNLTRYEEALWTAVSGLGDRDTIAAIVGSIVVMSADTNLIPLQWIEQAENIDDSVFNKKI